MNAPIQQALITQTVDGAWLRVESFAPDAIVGTEVPGPFGKLASLLEAATAHPFAQGQQRRVVSPAELKVPLAHLSLKSLGVGLTYPDHQREVRLSGVVFFDKNAEPTSLREPVSWRPYLDYEAEIALLLHRQEPELFGYLIHNDLTDRMIQVREFNSREPGPGFSQAKSFQGANAVSPVMAVGGESLWPEMKVELFLNDRLVQEVRPARCVLTPRQLHQKIFEQGTLASGFDWVLVGTGTPGGTIFRSPSCGERVKLLLASGLRIPLVKRRWPERFTFLRSGDSLRFRSTILGEFTTEIC